MRYPICAKYYESYNRYLRVSFGLSRLQVLLYRCIKMCSHLTVGVEGLVIEHTSHCFVRVFRAWLLQSRWIIGVHWTMCIPVKPNQLQWTYYRSKGGAAVIGSTPQKVRKIFNGFLPSFSSSKRFHSWWSYKEPLKLFSFYTLVEDTSMPMLIPE